jgi:glyoxylase-like metal-dependent hydrolase (beta-lactamase superfamily II)
LVETQLEDFQVRGAVIAGREKMVIWDTLSRPADMADIAEMAPTLPLAVVYSHADWDHVLGTSGLTRSPSEVVAHAHSEPRFDKELPGILAERRRLDPISYRDAWIVPPTRTVMQDPRQGEGVLMDLGGVEIELHPLPGHTPDSLVAFVPRWGIFLGGDSVETPLPFLNPGSPIGVWAESLGAWADKLEEASEACLVIPSHGRVGGPELLRETARYLEDLLAGEVPELIGDLSPFYRETHANNMGLARRR